jgi:tetratricopeptide (TPR) repeat protein
MSVNLDQKMKELMECAQRHSDSPERDKFKWYDIASLSMAYLYFGELEKARDLFRQNAEWISHNMGPKDYEGEKDCQNADEIRVMLAILYDLAGDGNKAKEEFEWAVTLCKDFFRYCISGMNIIYFCTKRKILLYIE